MRKSTVLLALCIALGFLVVPSFASSGAESAADSVLDPVYLVTPDTAYVLLSSAAPASSGISLLASTTPSYPSGTGYSYYYSSSSSLSRGDFYVAVTESLARGFRDVISKLSSGGGGYTSTTAFISRFEQLVGASPNPLYKAFSGVSTGLSSPAGFSTGSHVLSTINTNLFYGFSSLFNGLGSIRSDSQSLILKVDSLDASLAESRNYLYGIDADTSFMSPKISAMNNSLNTLNWTYTFGSWDSNGKYTPYSKKLIWGEVLSAGLYSLNTQLSGVISRMTDPLSDAIKDATDDQRNEFKDEFTGEGSKGVQKGQSSSMGDLSSSAGSLLDSGGSIGNVFSEIGNSGSSVWSWFSQENANAINGVGGAVLISDDDLDQPEIEVVDFYGAQREELLSMLGGG